MRLTVVGSAPAAPQTDTPASGILVQSDHTSVLFDCGSGVMGRLREVMDPTMLDAVVVGHLHADHFIDLAALRYLFPWAGIPAGRPTIWMPPGGIARLEAMAALMSERPTFFDEAFNVREYRSDRPVRVGELEIHPAPMQHYVPAWAMRVEALSGAVLVYGGDTGPTDALARLATGADVLVAEATLTTPLEDEVRRGHSTAAESILTAEEAGVERLVLTHYPSARRRALAALADATTSLSVQVGRPGLTLDIQHKPAVVQADDAGRPGSGDQSGGTPGGGDDDSAGGSSSDRSTDAIRSRIPSPVGSGPSNTSALRQ